MQPSIAKKTRRFYSFGPYRLYVGGDLVRDGSAVALPPKTADVLSALVSRHGRVVSKDELLREVWPDAFVEESSLTYQISQLRKALGDRPDGQPYIETSAKRGYRFAATVTESWEDEPDTGAKPQVVDPADARTGPRRSKRPWAAAAAALAAVLALGVYLGTRLVEGPTEAPLRRFEFTPPIQLRAAMGFHPNVGVSPDGRWIVFTDAEEGLLWVHDLERGGSRPLSGTQGADDPFWSPDSQRIGYFSGARILAVPVGGGPSTRIYQREGSTDAVFVDPTLRGAAWSPDGNSIVFSQDGDLFQAPARGGSAELLVDSDETGDEASILRWPHFLPASTGKRALLYTAGTGDLRKIIVHDLNNGEQKALRAGELPSYSASGHILYQAGPETYEIWALPFSAGGLTADGDPFPVAGNARFPMTTADKSLIYLKTDAASRGDRLAWVGRDGQVLERFGDPHGQILTIELSDDGSRAAVEARDDGNVDVWIYDLRRRARMRLTTGEEPDIDPVWSPDGRRVAFASRRTDSMDVYVAPADGSREATLWFGAADANERPTQWKADPSVLIVWRGSPSGRAMEVVPVSSQTVRPPGEPITSIAGARLGRLSPDGRYLAYGSDRSGRAEVYVRTFPNGEHRIQVSVDGGRQPRWSPDGSELFYVQDDSLLAVRFTSSAVPAAGVPEKVFSRMGLATSVDVGFPGIAAYDVASDGSRFLVRERLPGTNAIRVVQNWFEEFRNER